MNAPYNAKTRPLQCRIERETQAAVHDYARAENITVAEALRRLVEWGLEAVRDGRAATWSRRLIEERRRYRRGGIVGRAAVPDYDAGVPIC
jgi:hypothetical protein